MSDRKLSELTQLSYTQLQGVDFVTILDTSESILANKNKVLDIDNLYQYILQRLEGSEQQIYLLTGPNSVQNGYLNHLHVNTIYGNTYESGSAIRIADGVKIESPGSLEVGSLFSFDSKTTGINFPAAGAIGIAQAGSETLRINPEGLILIGVVESKEINNTNPTVQIVRSNASLGLVRYSQTADGPGLLFTKQRSSSALDPGAVLDGDCLGRLDFIGGNGSDLSAIGAQLSIEVDGEPFGSGSTTDLPGRFVFLTSNDGSAIPSEKLRISADGSLSFKGDTDTKLYSAGTGTLAVSVNSNEIFKVNSAGIVVRNQIEWTNSGNYKITLNQLALTNNQTISLPNASGTVVVTGDTGVVTASMIASNTITNTQINASAAIVDTKLATISTANKVSLQAIDLDGATEISSSLADVDVIFIDDGGNGTNRKATVTRIPPYVFSKISGDVTINSSGISAIASGVIINDDINANADIAVSKLAVGTAYQLVQTNSTGSDVEWTNEIFPESITITGTGALTLPAGTGTERPLPATNGMIRYNTDTKALEGYLNSAWVEISDENTDYGFITVVADSEFDYGSLS